MFCLPAHSVDRTFKGTSSAGCFRLDGVSTYLALTFGTLLSSQGTDASFAPVSPGSPGASLRSCVSDSIRSLRLRFSPVRFGLSASSRFQPYQIRFRLRPPVGAGLAVRLSLFGFSDSIRSCSRRCRSEFFSDSPSEGVCLLAFPTLSEGIRPN
ncbi:hypothetical protein DY245_00370 [Streptomyces inhibens]|uniref:Uncharacterized protein n=1 Tax=Streptomyces inhibens TaxID=2293571 RepID=A0A371QC10_STRIH|nr:hypothetical protein DY245_00370 [Streptomyces inhibens]